MTPLPHENPRGHGKQSVDALRPGRSPLYVPAAHGEPPALPAAHHDPKGHGTDASDDGDGQMNPAGHCRHTELLVAPYSAL